MLLRLIRFWKLVQLGEYVIRDVHERLIPLRLNRSQYIVLAACMRQAATGKPIRVTILKARKVGISTFIEVLCSYLGGWYENQRAKLIAHRDKSTQEIFEIATRAAKHHTQRPSTHTAFMLRWQDTDSSYIGETAGGSAVSAGGTPNIAHLSEVAKWHLNKRETWYNVVNAIARTPTSCIFVESTAKGRELFFNHWDASQSPEAEYEAIFIPWFYDQRCSAPASDALVADSDEQDLIRRAATHGVILEPEMLQWRRNKIAEIGPEAFRQEYPSTPEEAVQGTTGLIFPHMRECIIDELPWSISDLLPENMVGGIDFGFNDPCVIWNAVLKDGVLVLIGYYRATESLADQHVEALVAGGTYWCDPANLTDRKHLGQAAEHRALGVRLYAAPRRRRVGEDIGAQEMRHLWDFARSGRLKIMRDVSKQLILECDNLTWNDRTGKVADVRSVESGHFDSIYSLKYLVLGVYRPEAGRSRKALNKPLEHSRRRQWQSV